MSEETSRLGARLTRITAGAMRARISAFDWSATPLGAMDTWSPSLRLAVDMILAANIPMALRWGPDLRLIYNDAYAPLLQERHPQALGARFSEHSPEFRDGLQAMHDDILSGVSGGYASERLLLNLERDGETQARTGHFTVSYSPAPDATAASGVGGVGGVLITAVEITATLETERALQETEKRYQLALEAAGGVGAWTWDFKTNKVHGDAGYAQLHNLAPERVAAGLPAQSFFPAIHRDDRAKVEAIALDAMKRGADFSHEYRLVATDGTVRWVYTRGSFYLDSDGKPLSNTGVLLDITDRKQVEAALRATQADLELAVGAARLGRWDHNPSTETRFWDRRARTIFGLPDDAENTPATFEQRIHPDDRQGVRAAVLAATDPAGDGELRHAYRIHRADNGDLRWLEVFGRAFFEGGLCTRFVGVVSDVTDRKLAELQLARQEETLRLALGAADVGIWELDVATGHMIWSDRCYAMFGVTPDTTVTLADFYACLHPEDLEAAREAMRQTLEPQLHADYAIEFRAIGPNDGVERWIAAQGQAFFAPDGQATRLLGATVNITERKRAELHLRLRLLVNELNHRVKNSLATIQAIAAQSFTSAQPLHQAQEAFTNRIVALAEAHDLLTRENWEGAELHDIANRLVMLHGGPSRFDLSGPSVRLSPRTALSLSMALHELATNAVKYGALSTPAGRILLRWARTPGAQSDTERLNLVWTERGGPPVTPPAKRGFGSRLIERGLAAELSGEAAIQFEPEGVVCRIQALLDA